MSPEQHETAGDSWVRRALLPPRFADAEKAASARMVYGFAWALIATDLVFNTFGMLLAGGGQRWLVVMAGQVLIGLITLLILGSGRITAAAWFLITASWAGMVGAIWSSGGLESASVHAELIVVAGAGLLLGWRVGLAAAAAAAATLLGFAWIQAAGLLPPSSVAHTPWSRADIIISYVVLVAVIVAIAMWNKQRAGNETLRELAARATAEKALAESRAVLSAVVEGASDAIFIKDLEGRYQFVNEAATRILGMPVEDVIGRDDTAIFPPEQADAVMANARQVLAAGRPFTREELVSPGTSAARWLLMTLGPLIMPDGSVTGVYGIGRDITERKLAEERMRATLDSLLDPHVLVEAVRDDAGQIADFVCVDANQPAADYFNLQRGQLIGARLSALLPAQTGDETSLAGLWARTIASGEPLILDDYANRYALPAVERRWDVRAVRIGDGVSHTWRDVTERYEIGQALRRRVEELDALQRISRLLAEQNDLPAALDEACREIEALFGAVSADIRLLPDVDEAAPAPALTLLGSTDTRGACSLSREESAADQALAGGQPVTVAAGTDDTCHVLAAPMVAASRTIGVLTIGREREHGAFTERALTVAQPVADALAAAVANQRLHEREKQQAADQERQRLARDLHDAVTQSIYAANLIAGALPAIWRSSPEDGMHNLATLQRLVRAALAEMRTLLFELRPTTLDETSLETLLQRLAEALEGHSEIDVEISVAPDLDLPRAVRLVFYRITQEALSNVGKYAGAGEVSISVTGDDSGAKLIVRDDGKGFDPARTRPDSMGLRIMRERSEEIGATVGIASAPGRGTTVTVVWSRHLAPDTPGTQAAVAPVA